MAVALACVALSHQAHAINKCKSPEGKVSFQDAPCPGAGEKLAIKPATGPGATPATTEAQSRLADWRSESAMADAIREKYPLVGMTVKQLNEAMGLATKVNTDTSTGTTREQAIFERPSETWYVYTRNGRVESIQHRPGAPIGGSADQLQTKSVQCPSAHEIKNAITSANSIALSTEEREMRWRHIQTMQKCR